MRRALMVALLAAVPGCGGGNAPTPVGPTPPVPTPTPVPAPTPTPSPPAGGAPTFTTVYDRLLAPNCTGCHGDTGSPDAGSLFMSSRPQAYAQLVNVPAGGSACAGQGARVIPGNPDGSLLVNKISRARPTCGLTMPPFGGPMAASDVQMVRDWIAAGARDD